MKTQKLLENAIVKDAYDEILYSDIVNESKALQELIDPVKSGETDNDRNTLAGDVFSSLYKMNPTIRDKYRGLNKSLMETMMNLQEYKNCRASTRCDDMASALGVMKLAPSVLESFEKAKKEQEKRQKDREKQRQQQKQQQQQQGQDNQPGEPNGEGDGDGQGQDPTDSNDQPGQSEGEFDQDIEDQLRQELRGACKDAQDAADEWANMCLAWGLGADELARMPIEKKFEIAEKLRTSSKFKKIADLMGRFKNLAQAAAATTVTHGQDEIVGITMGDDLGRILPSELIKLKKTPTLFFKDFLERSLQVYELIGVENLGYGPIICCLDISPSMQGEREEYAKALILAMMFLAEKQHRKFGIITFGSGVRPDIEKELFPKSSNQAHYYQERANHVYKFFPEKCTLEEKIDIASIQCNGGGTNFFKPLMAAFKMRRDNMAALNPSDIVFITDGECDVTPEEMNEIKKQKAETMVRIQGVGICDISAREVARGTALVEFSDNLSMINRLGEISDVKSIFNNAANLTTKTKKRAA